MNWKLEEMTDSEFEALNDALALVNLARKVGRRFGLNDMDDYQIADLSIRIYDEERRRGKTIMTIMEVAENV